MLVLGDPAIDNIVWSAMSNEPNQSFRAENAKGGLLVQRIKNDRVIAESLCRDKAELQQFVESFR